MYVVLFSHVKITSGIKRSIIIDYKNQCYFIIPNSLSNLFKRKNYNKQNFKTPKNKNSITIKSYIDFLISKKLAFLSNKKPGDTDNCSYISPYLVENAIIDFSLKSDYSLLDAIDKINLIMCPSVQLRLFSKINFEALIKLIKNASEKSFSSIEIYVENTYSANELLVIERTVHEDRRFEICFYNSANEKVIENIRFVTTFLKSEKNCGVINSNTFFLSPQLYTLSKHFNSCLYKKISISQYGEIKNCPSMNESFGNIKDGILQNLLKKKEFVKYWGITKDKISTCKNCEFRHICTDCRAYRQKTDDIYSKPIKCGYDPSTNIWEDWSINALNKKTIEFYRFENIADK